MPVKRSATCPCVCACVCVSMCEWRHMESQSAKESTGLSIILQPKLTWRRTSLPDVHGRLVGVFMSGGHESPLLW